MAQAINVPVSVQVQNNRQLTQQVQASLNAVRLNLGNGGRALSSLSQPLGRLTGQADEFSKSLDAANARVLAFGASVGIVNAFSNAFKGLVSSTIEVEKAIKAITVVGDQFNGKTKQLTQGLFNVAKVTGQSFAEVSKAALEFSRQGLGVEDTLQRTQDALILTRLTGLDAAKAVEGLTAAANGFTKAGLSTTQILNKLAAVDQAFAVSSADLIEGFNRSAAVAENAGVSFDELAGIITALQQKTSRGGAVIGNALKTIFTRLQDTSTLNQLEGLGIAVEDLQNNILPARQILQNLAKDVQGLGKITKAGIFKDVAGTFQINQLISLVEDLNNKNSVAANATKKAAGATNEAFAANEKLNQSLDAIINKVALTGKQLGSLIGELGLSDSFKGILDGINSFLEGAANLLQGDDLGSKFAKGIVKGIGAVFTGPGLGIFLAVIAKLTLDLVKFGAQSVKTFFGIGKAAKEQQQVQESIVQTLLRNENVLRSILNTQGGQNAQAQTFLRILNQQEQALQNIRSLAGGIAAPLIAGGYGVGPQGGIQRRGRAAGGYLPAQEAADVRRGVGGASPNSKVVAIPNFAFGGGKRGTMIANTSEYIVPNYAGGGSAIFNQDMAKTMGLPAGAKKISAAGGFVPNFEKQQKNISFNNYSVEKLLKKAKSFEQVGKVDLSEDDFNGKINIIRQRLTNDEYNARAKDITNKIIPKLNKKEKRVNARYLNTQVSSFKNFGVDQSSIDALKTSISNASPNNGGYMSVRNRIKGILGEIDASVLSGKSLTSGNADLDLAGGGEVKTRRRTPLSNLIKKSANNLLRNKNFNNNQPDSIDLPNLDVYLPIGGSIDKSASNGYIPNFANYVYDSDRLGPGKNEILQAILDSTVTKNLLVGPAGAGKSTAAAGLGTFIKSIDDVGKASSFTILSAAGLSKEGGFSTNFQNILNAVKESGGKTTYLGVTNEELKRRRASRTASEGDLRSQAQLAGTVYAPLNQSAFIKQLKKGSGNFEMMRSGKGGFTNNQLAVLGLYGENSPTGIDGSPIYTLESRGVDLARNIKGEYETYIKSFVAEYSQELANKIGVTRTPKEVKKAIQQSSSISGFIFEDVLNQLAGDFDTNSISGGARADFRMTGQLRSVFKAGQEKYAEAKLNPYTSDAAQSVRDKQLALASGATAPTEISSSKVKELRERAIALGIGKGGRVGRESQAQRNSFIQEMINAGLIKSGYGTSADQTTAIKRVLGIASGGYIPNFANSNFNGNGIVDPSDGIFARLRNTAKKYAPTASPIIEQVLQNLLGLPEGTEVIKTVEACVQAMTVLKEEDKINEKLRKIALEKKQTKRREFLRGRSSSGFIPSFAASALQQAIAREKSAGLSSSQIYVDKNPSLKSPLNPMGLMVANTRDEPFGGAQGIARARQEGVDPKFYGAANGFVPNYAAQIGEVSFSDKRDKRLISQADLDSFNQALKNIASKLKKGAITLQVAESEIQQLANNAKTNAVGQRKLAAEANILINAYDSEIKARKQKAQELLKQRAEGKQNRQNQNKQGFGDLASKLVLAQSAMTFLSTAASEVGGKFEQLVTGLSQAIGSIVQFGFLLQGTKLGQKITDSFKGLLNRIPGVNKIGGAAQGGSGLLRGIGGGIAKFAGRAAGPLGLAVGAGFLVKGLADAFKTFSRKDLSASFDRLSESASKAANSLDAAGKEVATFQVKQGETLGFWGRASQSLQNIVFDVAKLNTGKENIQFSAVGADDASLQKVINDLVTANVAAGTADSRGATAAFLQRIGTPDGIIGEEYDINFEEAKTIEALVAEYERLAIISEGVRKKKDFALAQQFAKEKTDEAVKSLNLNKVAVEALRVQYAKLKDGILQIDIETAFQKFTNKTLLDLNSGLSESAKSVEEFKNSLKEVDIDLDVDKAKLIGAELEKINTDITSALRGVGATVNQEQINAIADLQTAIATGDTSKLEELTKSLVGLGDSNLRASIETLEKLKDQTQDLDRQAKLKKAQLSLDFAAKTLTDQQTLNIEKQNSILEKRLGLIEKEFEFKQKTTDLDRQISDARFETGLIGKSQTATLTAQRGRVAETQKRADQDVIRELQQRLVDSIKSIEIPTTLSPEAQQNLKAQRNASISGILQEPSGANPQEQIKNLTDLAQRSGAYLTDVIVRAEQEASDYAFDQTIEAANGFANIIIASASDFANRLTSSQQAAINALKLPVLQKELEQARRDQNRATQNPKGTFEQQMAGIMAANKKVSDLESQIKAIQTPEAVKATEAARAEVKARTEKLKADREAADAANAATEAERLKAEAAQAGTLAAKGLTLNQALATKSAKEFGQSLLELGSSFTILRNLVRDYIEGLPSELANLQFAALQSTSPDDLASKLIGQQAIKESEALNPKGISGSLEDQKKQTEFVAARTALLEKQYEISIAESATRRRELQYEEEYLKRFLELKKEGATVEELAAERRRQIEEQRTFGRGFERGLDGVQDSIDNYRSELGQEIPRLFSQNLAQGLNDAISGAKSLKDALRDAATSFLNAITQKNIENLANLFTVGAGNTAKSFFASGGQVNGGSGTKDDVPAMLMGGEYVIKKSAVKKYGSKFLDSLNNGGIKAFAAGGGVQSGRGGFYVPGDYGEGAITGKNQLLAFAGQSFTGGQYDQIGVSGMSGASVNLESESARLTAFGRENSPMFERVQQAKEEAFNVYLNQLKQEQQYREQKKQIAEAEKARKKQLTTAIVSAVVSSALSYAGSAFGTGAENAVAEAGAQAGKPLTNWQKFTTGFKGGSKNLGAAILPGGAKPTFTLNDYAKASRLDVPISAYRSNIRNNSIVPYRPSNYAAGRVSTNSQQLALPVSLSSYGGVGAYYNPLLPAPRAFGGMVTGGSGIRDDVPAMLTGGEFVLNNRATRKLGIENLNRLNSGDVGGSSGNSGQQVSESIISKLDELIQTTRESSKDNVVVNVSGMEGGEKRSDENKSVADRELQRKIKDAVLAVLAQEKRLGGSLNK